MNKPVYLDLSILGLSNTVMYEFCYDYVKPKYGEKAKLCYMNTDSFLVYIKTYAIYKDIAEDAEKRCSASNYKLERSLPNGENKRVIGLIKDKLRRKII